MPHVLKPRFSRNYLPPQAVLDGPEGEGAVAYFLPRNTDGVVAGRAAVSAGIAGAFELEQNVVNGKVKAITAYFGRPARE